VAYYWTPVNCNISFWTQWQLHNSNTVDKWLYNFIIMITLRRNQSSTQTITSPHHPDFTRFLLLEATKQTSQWNRQFTIVLGACNLSNMWMFNYSKCPCTVNNIIPKSHAICKNATGRKANEIQNPVMTIILYLLLYFKLFGPLTTSPYKPACLGFPSQSYGVNEFLWFYDLWRPDDGPVTDRNMLPHIVL
jgi:hypothetical protein